MSLNHRPSKVNQKTHHKLWGKAVADMANQTRQDLNVTPFIQPTDPDDAVVLWERWIQNFCRKLRFFKVTDAADKVDALLIYGGETVERLAENLPDPTNVVLPESIKSSNEDVNEFHKIIFKINEHYTPMQNKDSARSVFESMCQGDKNMAEYHVVLRKQAVKCQFPDDEDAIRTKILQSMNDKKLRREAMVKNYTLNDILKHAANREDVERQAKTMEKDSVNRVYEQRNMSGGSHNKFKKYSKEHRNSSKKRSECKRCGGDHEREKEKCPAYGKECRKCGKMNHYARKCLSGKPKNKDKPSKPVQDKARQVTDKSPEKESSSDSDTVFSVNSSKDPRPTVKVRVNGVKGNMDADSCSSCNIMGLDHFNKIKEHSAVRIKLEHADNQVYSYASSKPLDLAGKFIAEIESVNTGKKMKTEFLVTNQNTNSRPLLSLKCGTELGVLQVSNALRSETENEDKYRKMVKEYPEVFEGLGKHKNIKAKFIVDSSVKPVVQKPRKIPYNLEKQVMKEEDRLIELGVIEVVPDEVPTIWCTNPVVVPKRNRPDDIRYCSNMRVPNEAIMRPTTEAMTVEDIRMKLRGATVFSVMDMNEAYHQLELEEESRYLTTFYGTRGRLRYKRLNYGPKSSQDIFDKAMDDTITGLNGVTHIRDDFVVFGSDIEDHDVNLRGLLMRFKEHGLTLKRKKCQFAIPEVEFFGLRFSKDGVRPSPSKIKALEEMSKPQSAAEVRSFLGMAQYSSQFIPGFSQITSPLRELTHKSSKWKWGKEEEDAFERIRTSLANDSVLGYYETGRQTKLVVDAGPKGLGAILYQKKKEQWKPITCASRSLTDTEQRYSQLDREALAIRWACEKNYIYLIGSKFKVITDHQPLVSIFNNRHSRPPMRIERWLIYLQQFEFKVEYEPGSGNPADYLSRHPLKLNSEDMKNSDKREEVVCKITESMIPYSMSIDEIRNATRNDKVLQELIPMIGEVGAERIKKNSKLHMYYNVFSELSVINDLVLRGNQIVVPTSLQEKVLDICHEGHLGIVKSKQRLRSKVWFPGIDKKMEAKIRGCIPCQSSVSKSTREPLVMTEAPERVWQRVAVDFSGPYPSGEMIFVCIDEKSRFPEVEIVKSTSFNEVELAMQKIFTRYGYPERLKSDNGAPFNSYQFKEYCQIHGIKHHRVTPLWPEANGLVENFMKVINKANKAATTEGKDWRKEIFVTLGAYRETSHTTTGVSPSYMMFGRSVRNKLPVLHEIKSQDVSREKEKKEKQKYYAEKRRDCKESKFEIGDVVVAKQPKKNKLTTCYNPEPYVIEEVNGSAITARQSGKVIRRNSSHFKKVNVPVSDLNRDECIEEIEQDNELIEQAIVEPETIQDASNDIVEVEEVEMPQSSSSTETSVRKSSSPVISVRRSNRESKKPKYLMDYEA